MMSESFAVKIEHLHKKYSVNNNTTQEFLALEDVSLEFSKGETVGIFGPNGSGKSTLLKILAGITKPTYGKVTISGRVASILDIGAGFHPELTGKENVYLYASLYGFDRRLVDKIYDEIVAFSGVKNFINERVKNYSNGMYLRLAFSIIVHLDFDIYLFDETFNFGDINFSLKVKEKINELKISKTIVVVSHNYNDLLDSDKFIFIRNGRVVEISSHNSLLMNYIDFEYFGFQTHHTKNFEIAKVMASNKSDDVFISSLKMFQKSSVEFFTNKPFTLIVMIEKNSTKNNYVLSINISDNTGSILMSSSPYLQINEKIEDAGSYEFEWTIPDNIFAEKVYSISIFLLKNFKNNKGRDNSLEYIRFDNIVSFYPKKPENNLKYLNFEGGLLPVFNWKKNKIHEVKKR